MPKVILKPESGLSLGQRISVGFIVPNLYKVFLDGWENANKAHAISDTETERKILLPLLDVLRGSANLYNSDRISDYELLTVLLEYYEEIIDSPNSNFLYVEVAKELYHKVLHALQLADLIESFTMRLG